MRDRTCLIGRCLRACIVAVDQEVRDKRLEPSSSDPTVFDIEIESTANESEGKEIEIETTTGSEILKTSSGCYIEMMRSSWDTLKAHVMVFERSSVMWNAMFAREVAWTSSSCMEGKDRGGRAMMD